MPSDLYYSGFMQKLRQLRTRELTVVTLVYTLKYIAAFGSIAVIAVLSESVLWLPAAYRTTVIGITLLCGIVLLVLYGRRPFRAWSGKDPQYSAESLAGKLGIVFPEIRDRLLNALQVFSQLNDSSVRYSPELIQETMNEAGKAFSHYDFAQSVDYSPLRRQSLFFTGFAAVVVLLGVFFGGGMVSSADRLVHPAQDFLLPASFTIYITPGDSSLIRSEPFTVRASFAADIVQPPAVFIKYESASSFEPFPMTRFDGKSFFYTLDHVRETFTYYVRRTSGFGILKRKMKSDIYTVSVINRPAVKKLQIHLDYPSYSGLTSRFLDDNIGDVIALKGTNARMELTLNKPAAYGSIHFSNGTEIPLLVRGETASASFTIHQDLRYTIHIVDSDSIASIDPIEYRISAVQDAYPFIQIITPKQYSDLTEDKQTPVGIKISDDFGLTRLRLGYKLLDRNAAESASDVQNLNELLKNPEGFAFSEIPLPAKSGMMQDVFFLWNLSSAPLFPDDRILFFAELYDNDNISGPKCSRTNAGMLRLPSVDELFKRAAEIQDKQTDAMNEIIEKSKELQQELTELSQKMLQAKELDWEQKQKTEEAVKKQEDLQRRMGDIKRQIEELVKMFEQNDILSAETLDKYKELQELLQELAEPKLKELLPKLQESLKNAENINANRQNTENLRQAQQDYIERIERTLNVLHRIQIEQMLDETVIKAEHLTETQKNINSRIDSLALQRELNTAPKTETEKLSQQETDAAKNADNLKNSVEKLLEKMLNYTDMSSEKVTAANELLQDKKLSEKMLSMSNELSQQAMQKAQTSGKIIEQDLSEVENSLKNARQELSQEQKEDILKSLRKSTNDLLALSNNQESARSESAVLIPNSDQFRTVADKQFELLSGLIRVIADLSIVYEKTFAIPIETRLHIAQSLNAMKESIKQLELRNREATVAQQNQSLSALNESIAELLKTTQNIQNSNTGMGFDEFMQQTEQLAGMQEQVNQKTQELAGGALSLEQQAALQRLMQDQEIIRKSIEQLQKEMQGKGSIEQRLEQMNQEIQEITRDLKDKTITERTLELQERILSRMLDSQRSVNRRDFSNKRLSETAKYYEGKDPGTLPENLGEQIRMIDAELMKALKEGYTKDFEELIKKYFENLNKQNITVPIKKE